MLKIIQQRVFIMATLIAATIILLPVLGQETLPLPLPTEPGDPALDSKAADEINPPDVVVDDEQSRNGGDEIPDVRETRRGNAKKPSQKPKSSLIDEETLRGPGHGYDGGGFGFGGGAPGGGVLGGAGMGNSRLIQGSSIMISFSKSNDELRGFSHTTGEWAHLKIEPQKRLIPVVSDTVGAVRVGDTMAAYSGATGSWDVLQLSKNSKAVPVVGSGLVQATDGERHYTFAAANGKWTSPNDPRFRTAPTASRDPALPLARFPVPHRIPAEGDSFNQDSLNLAKQLRGRGLDDSQARATMTESVSAAFERRQQAQREEAKRLQQKLEKINAALQNRERLRRRIIERRVEELLDPAIDWDADNSPNTQFPVPGLDPGIAPSARNSGLRGLPGLDPGIPSAINFGLPPAGNPIGLPGAPHLPYGMQRSLPPIQAKPNIDPEPGVRSPGNQPSEVTQRLYDRQRLALQTADILRDAHAELKEFQQPLSILARNPNWKDLTEDNHQEAIRFVQRTVARRQQELKRLHAAWKQDWAVYQSQVKLLQLNIEKAAIQLDQAKSVVQSLTDLAAGTTTEAEFLQAETNVALKQIDLERAKQQLVPYLTIEDESKELNPENFNVQQLLNGETTEN